MTSPQYRECMNNYEWLLTQMIVYSLPKSNHVYWELVPGPRRAKLRMERLFHRSNARGQFLVISNVFWEVNYLETTYKTTPKLSYNLSKKRPFPCSFLEFRNFAWIMRFLTNYAKRCDLRSIMQNRNMADYQKPWKLISHDNWGGNCGCGGK